ncbi:hypothetical protein [Clostridioides sp. ES-S-0010-02]|uniref:hypothetical protein n=1 Tax=Clostridioides sp. ES-S-0010-02 TaxID=2770776 RepID=UPI001D12A3B9|nr:hypothetical protein JJC01_19205 [Clostridioides sp. ES-S-0010-02]
MPYMYMSKVNLNSKIYEVHDKKIKLQSILDELFDNISDEHSYIKDTVSTYEDLLGQEKKREVKEEYIFTELDKDKQNKIITGNIVRIKPKFVEEYNREIKKNVLNKREESTNIYFYFDLYNELITFCTRNKFGHSQFNEAFKNLLELNLKKYGFEVFLKKDKSVLEEKLSRFKRVDKVVATIIPPNANNNDVDDLINDSYEYKAANIKKAKLEYESSPQSSEGLDMQALAMQRLIKSASYGYGDLNVHGKTKDDTYEVLRTNKDAAVITTIEEGYDENEFNKQAQLFISSKK